MIELVEIPTCLLSEYDEAFFLFMKHFPILGGHESREPKILL